jgi:hypothetical protein
MELRERNRRVSGQYLLAREYRRLHRIAATDDSTVRLHIISFLAKSDVCCDHVAKEMKKSFRRIETYFRRAKDRLGDNTVVGFVLKFFIFLFIKNFIS